MVLLFCIVMAMFIPAFAGQKVEFSLKGSSYSKYIIQSFDRPVLRMEWVRLEEGGYMVSGDTSPVDRGEPYSCRFLTDFTLEEVIPVVKQTYGFVEYRLYVKSLNAVVELNKTPSLAVPYRPFINPTTVSSVGEMNRILKERFTQKMENDIEFRNRFKQLKEKFIREGLSEETAEREAKKVLIVRIAGNIKRWIPEEKLPRKLHLVCVFAGYDKYRLYMYPVELTVKREKTIEIIAVEKTKKDIKITVSFHPGIDYRKVRAIGLDLITDSPPETGKKAGNCRHRYVGGILHAGSRDYTDRYKLGFSSSEKGFFLFLFPAGRVEKAELFIRPGIYCSDKPKKQISLLNPEKGDRAPLNETVQLHYSIENFLKENGLKSIKLRMRIVSPEGYSSDWFTVSIP
ncbi:hypothetical protein [Persephonella sp.]